MAAVLEKSCVACGRRITWRKKWARDWESIRYCSDACRGRRVRDVDSELEQASEIQITQRGSVVDPSSARGPIRLR